MQNFIDLRTEDEPGEYLSVLMRMPLPHTFPLMQKYPSRVSYNVNLLAVTLPSAQKLTFSDDIIKDLHIIMIMRKNQGTRLDIYNRITD